MHSILIQNATVLTMDPKLGDIKGCDILIEGSRIVDIRPGIHAPASQLVDATEMIVTPGYVDSHRHTWQCLMRNVRPTGAWASTTQGFGSSWETGTRPTTCF